MKTNYWLILALVLSTSVLAQESTNPPAAAPAPAAPKAPEPLSKATLDKIAKMTPIFDGKTLDGWIQLNNGQWGFGGGDIVDLDGLIKKLTDKSDPVSEFLAAQLDENARTNLTAYSAADAASAKAVRGALAKNIARIIAAAPLEKKLFEKVQLRPETEKLLENKSDIFLPANRLLIEDAYPKEVKKCQPVGWTVKDGALASVGADRGVIYTKDDYTNYRIIFNMRELSGNHQPCVLLFCTRPTAGKKPLDAIGGIQFQVPNGGHWDYRPGFNNGGQGFTNPIKTKYNNHEWSQVEILVNAKEGTARMAVAQPIGTKGIENLVYKNAEAGKTGPFALQMHNAGLFDEYKDIRVEIDPADDKLITAQ